MSPRRPGTLACFVVLFLLASCSRGASEPDDGWFHWSISTTVEIDASQARVWEVLVDLPAYSEWNPFIVEGSGSVAEGERLELRMALPGWEPMTIEPRLLAVDPERELRWRGQLVLPGLFDGEHSFVLTSLADGRTRLDHSERFAGLLLPIARFVVYDETEAAFHAMDAALAERARTITGSMELEAIR